MARIFVEEPRDYSQASAVAADALDSRGGGGTWIILVAILIALFVWNYTPFSNSEIGPYNSDNPYTGSTSNVRYVIASELNLREAPGINARVTYILPRDTAVVLLGETSRDYTGEVWVKVSVDTAQGRVIGWVSNRYIA